LPFCGEIPVAKRSRQRRSANNKSARCGLKKIARQQQANQQQSKTSKRERSNPALFQSPKRPSEYQGHRAFTSDRSGTAMPILIGAAIIGAAILLSTLITTVGTRFMAMDSPNDDNVWLIDRLTGNVYKCQASERGKASCEPDIATGSVGERGKR
jgi:hypothetical protein